MLVLLDENLLSKKLKKPLVDVGHSGQNVENMGWRGVRDQELLALAEAHPFDMFITADKNLPYQQNLRGLALRVVVLDAMNTRPYPENIFWIIEYSNSSLTKDLETKSKVYAEVGIAEYWVANLQELQLVVFRNPQNGEYTSRNIFTNGTIQPLAFPGIDVFVEAILNP